MANDSNASQKPAAIVVADGSTAGSPSRIAELVLRDRSFVATKSIAEALAAGVRLVVVPEPGSDAEEADLLAHARQGTTAALFFANDDARRLALLRAGATDVLSTHTSDAELVFRIERALDASIRTCDAQARQSELEALAYTDSLTGLANRRFFDELLRREVARANRYRRPLSLVLIDLDHFKRINDLLGHAAGDHLLAQVARQVHLSTRTSDCAARFGGDELAAILGDVDASGARIYANRVVKALSELTIFPDVPDIRCSLSMGIASYGLEPTTPAEMLRRADRALYRAKAMGRGRIEIESW